MVTLALWQRRTCHRHLAPPFHVTAARMTFCRCGRSRLLRARKTTATAQTILASIPTTPMYTHLEGTGPSRRRVARGIIPGTVSHTHQPPLFHLYTLLHPPPINIRLPLSSSQQRRSLRGLCRKPFLPHPQRPLPSSPFRSVRRSPPSYDTSKAPLVLDDRSSTEKWISWC